MSEEREINSSLISKDSGGELWPLHESNINTGLPLEGIRVLDLSRVLAGPMCAMIAGDLGADVIKVEAPNGDPVRGLAPPRFGDDATYFLAVNRHRRNVTADLRDPDDFAQVQRLVERADVVIENFLPQQSSALGIDDLRTNNPEVVWVSVTPASKGGVLSNEPSFDLLAQARSGIMSVTGEAEGGPTKVAAPIADVITGLYATIGLLSGLFARATGSSSRHFEAPLLESTMSALINQVQGYLVTGDVPQRLGNHHPSIAPYGPVTTSDGFLLLAVGTDSQYLRLVNVLEDEQLRATNAFAQNDGRIRRRDELQANLDRVFSTRTTAQWERVLQGSGVPFAPILDIAEAINQPQIAGGDLVSTVDAPAGRMKTVGSPMRVDGVRPKIRRGPRRLGEDNFELGFTGSASDRRNDQPS